MLQITKDRLFALGLQIPAEVQIKGDATAVDWAHREIEKAVELGQPGRVTAQLEKIQEREDQGEYDTEGPVPVALSDILSDVNLVEALRAIHDAASELLEVARLGTGGQADVIGRLGNIPAMPEFLAWAQAMLAPPESGAELAGGIAAVLEDGLAETVAPPPDPPAEEGAAEPHTPEELEAMDAELADREEVDAIAREGAEVTTSAAEEAPAAAAPGEAGPPSWGMELDAVKERLTKLERVVNSLGA